MNRHDELWQIVASIPAGSVASYGAVGRTMQNPVSGLIVGRWMAACPPEVPWWRVVGTDGRCPIWKRDPRLFEIQRKRLESEGTHLEDGKVPPERFCEPDPLSFPTDLNRN